MVTNTSAAPPTFVEELRDGGLYPFESHYLAVDGAQYHYIDEGAGEPILMLHGNPTWSFYFRRLVTALSGTHRTVVPDHVGCGLSEKPDDSRYAYTLSRRVDDVEALVDHAGIGKNLTLVVHDWGGMIGMAYAARRPESIARLVILNTGAFHLPNGKRFPWTLRLCRNPWIGAPLVRGLNAFSRSAVKMCCTTRPMPKDVQTGYLGPYDSWKHRIAVHRFVQDIPLQLGDPGYDIVSDVERNLERFVETPALICWGAKDFVFDDHFLEEWKRRLPQAAVHRFADAGHYVLEDAHERIIPLVQGFLKEHPTTGGAT